MVVLTTKEPRLPSHFSADIHEYVAATTHRLYCDYNPRDTTPVGEWYTLRDVSIVEQLFDEVTNFLSGHNEFSYLFDELRDFGRRENNPIQNWDNKKFFYVLSGAPNEQQLFLHIYQKQQKGEFEPLENTTALLRMHTEGLLEEAIKTLYRASLYDSPQRSVQYLLEKIEENIQSPQMKWMQSQMKEEQFDQLGDKVYEGLSPDDKLKFDQVLEDLAQKSGNNFDPQDKNNIRLVRRDMAQKAIQDMTSGGDGRVGAYAAFDSLTSSLEEAIPELKEERRVPDLEENLEGDDPDGVAGIGSFGGQKTPEFIPSNMPNNGITPMQDAPVGEFSPGIGNPLPDLERRLDSHKSKKKTFGGIDSDISR